MIWWNNGEIKRIRKIVVYPILDRFTELNSLVKQAKQSESDGMSKHFLHSKDKDSSDTPVASFGIHVLPPSPISNSDSLSSNEGKFLGTVRRI